MKDDTGCIALGICIFLILIGFGGCVFLAEYGNIMREKTEQKK